MLFNCIRYKQILFQNEQDNIFFRDFKGQQFSWQMAKNVYNIVLSP